MSPSRASRPSLEEFLATHPRIAGGDPAVDEPATDVKSLLDSLDTEIKALSQTPASSTEAGASSDDPAPEADAPAADTKEADLAARETALAASQAQLEAQSKQLAGLVKGIREHGGSRFAGPDADPAIIEHLAKGGEVEYGGLKIVNPRSVQAGSATGVKALKESKSIVQFLGAIAATTKGYASDAQREWMMGQKALAEQTGSAGGFLVPPDWMPDILQLFRGVTVVRRARPGRIVPFTAQMNQVELTAGATAFYTPENAAIPTSQETFAQVTLLTPKNLTGLVPASNWLLADTSRTDVSSPLSVDAEQAIRQDLSVVMALKEDRNFLFGNPGTETGSPTGITNISGIVTSPLAVPTNGFQPTLPQIRALKNYPRRFNIPNARWTWFFHSEFLSYVEGLTDSLGRFLADAPNLLSVNNDDMPSNDPAASGSIVGAGAGMSGTLLNLPFYCSNQIPVNIAQGSASNATWLLLVDMNQLVVGLNRDLVIEASSEASYTPDGGTTWISAFQNNQTLFKATLRHDINHLYPQIGIIQQQGVLVS